MSAPKAGFVSSSGSLVQKPLTSRIYDAAQDYVEVAYLFFDTLVTVSKQRYPLVKGHRR